MRRWKFFFLIFCFIQGSFCQSKEEKQQACAFFPQKEFHSFLKVHTGYRRDFFSLVDFFETQSIEGGTTLVKAEDSQSWPGLSIFDLKGELFFTYRRFLVKLDADYGWILEGENPAVDSQVLQGDGTTRILSTVSSGKSRGYVWDASVAGAVQLVFFDSSVKVMPEVGFSYHKQKPVQKPIQASSSVEIVSVGTTRYIGSGDRKVSFAWFGPWLGIDLSYFPLSFFELFGEYKFHLGNSRLFGKADLLLTQTFPEATPQPTATVLAFRTFQKDKALGHEGTLGFRYRFLKRYLAGLRGGYTSWYVLFGRKVNKYEEISIESLPVSAVGKADKIYWRSWNILAFFGFDF